MRTISSLVTAALLAFSTGACASAEPPPAAVAEDEALGHALTLVQTFVRIGAQSEDPVRAYDELLSGRNAEANRAFAGLFDEITAELPPEHRSKVASIGRDIASLARRGAGRGASASAASDAIQARKELHGMGLTYYDERQYREAVRRGDRIAVDLFVAAQGLPPSVTNPPAAR